jgi:orotate phosphoribosyltransferase
LRGLTEENGGASVAKGRHFLFLAGGGKMSYTERQMQKIEANRTKLTAQEEIAGRKAILARNLIGIEAIKIDVEKPFTFTSGIKSPIYCDMRALSSHPMIRSVFYNYLTDLVVQQCGGDPWVAGTATAGIIPGFYVANSLQTPMFYVRSQNKGHGTKSRVEGGDVKGKILVVVEDLITTGGSLIETVHALREEGAFVHKVFSIFNYGFSYAKDAFKSNEIKCSSLLSFHDMIAAINLKKEEDDVLQKWWAGRNKALLEK